MLLKSGSEIYLCISLTLVSWGFSSAFFFPNLEKAAARENPVYTYSSTLGRFVEVEPVNNYLPMNMEDMFATRANYIHKNALIQQLISHNAELQNTNHFLTKIAERSIEHLALLGETKIDDLIKLKTEKLQSEITANTAAIEDLKRKVANLVPKKDSDILKEDKDVSEPEEDLIELLLQGEGDGEDTLESQVNTELYQYKGGDNSKFERDLFNIMKAVESPADKELDQNKESNEDNVLDQHKDEELERELFHKMESFVTLGLDQNKGEGEDEDVLESQELDQYKGEDKPEFDKDFLEELDSQIKQRLNQNTGEETLFYHWDGISNSQQNEGVFDIEQDESSVETQTDEGGLSTQKDESSLEIEEDKSPLEMQNYENPNVDYYNDYENGM
ncbi:uncharacterized protein LOC117785379 [Drosophila innubila]|uniref:uncharacterized protein LOC117785379 n=1 Tax=Drosophila innubila TaxID=198719 RepID=UPI00148D4821|nr:uncharacterized protein LOC117785379 [Drosophila innubila]